MNRQQTTDLYGRGKAIWNSWAEEMLSRRKELEESGQWLSKWFYGTYVIQLGGHASRKPRIISTETGQNQITRQWLVDAQVDFSSHDNPSNFDNDLDFSEWLFPSVVRFSGAKFNGTVSFLKTRFVGAADFGLTQFSGRAIFDDAVFSDVAWFDGASFGDDVYFPRVAFEKAARFRGAKFSNTCVFTSANFKEAADFRVVNCESDARFECSFESYSDFNGAEFSSVVFSGSTFAKNARFHQTVFKRSALLGRTIFHGSAEFQGSIFRDRAWLDGSHFFGATNFENAKFSSITRFNDSAFSSDISLNNSSFDAFTTFDGSEFSGNASFRAISSQSGFSISNTSFNGVPDFVQAHFVEAPQLDNVTMSVATGVKDAATLARFRALKRLAVQGHDTERAIGFLASEIKGARGITDNFKTPRWWFGYFYEICSDLGRSIIRPAVFFVLLIVLFWGIYLGSALGAECLAAPQGSDVSVLFEALALSLRSAIIFDGGSDASARIFGCLYGQPTSAVPSFVNLLIGVQKAASGVLIFLFGLAIRNMLRMS